MLPTRRISGRAERCHCHDPSVRRPPYLPPRHDAAAAPSTAHNDVELVGQWRHLDCQRRVTSSAVFGFSRSIRSPNQSTVVKTDDPGNNRGVNEQSREVQPISPLLCPDQPPYSAHMPRVCRGENPLFAVETHGHTAAALLLLPPSRSDGHPSPSGRSGRPMPVHRLTKKKKTKGLS